ncbi:MULTISPECIES: ubiquinol-cytochrome c reductase iron-sulfur subunit [Methylorubrum]|uniref:QcrA and Rieske domain-containing protein n=1 Tax=Methylorubrum TaxID=2282523 RepID=UPI00209E16C7|nr:MULTISPECIES: Rieske 2Fe-2S domain-containing protein [Methylorubrum]MCP1550310.1 Rieske Fe-S protein [Methylorubrum zatmanii]MCP1553077.1 Rieske Fe-S protein [Methylorubrum extorquens]MCP1580613.1 Rieske Fe-S protein [Methylorubrum extorquens]
MSASKNPKIMIDRRTALLGVAGCCLAAGPVWAGPEEDLPAKGDTLVFDDGPLEGKPVTLDAIKEGEPALAIAVDTATGTKKTESRFAKIVLARVPEADIDEDTKPFTADGVIALSAICTHQGCSVTGWNAENKSLLCFCHGSEFVPGEGGRVEKGPARKRIPVLPIAKGEKGEVVITEGFRGKPGPGA